MGVVRAVISRLKKSMVARFHLALENLALRQQLDVLQRSGKRPKLRQRDRIFWILLSALWPDWRSSLVIVKPETVLGWRRQGFRLCQCWKSKTRKPGRPPINEEIRKLIRRMARENVTWGAPRIESELRLLGYTVAERTVAK
jgi:putative transposase